MESEVLFTSSQTVIYELCDLSVINKPPFTLNTNNVH